MIGFRFTLPRNTKNKAANLVINQNDRFHFHAQAKMVTKLRDLAEFRGLKLKQDFSDWEPFSKDKPCRVLISIARPTRRRLDPPNLYPTVKALIDGLTDAGIWTDDNDEVIQSMTFESSGLSGIKGRYIITIKIKEKIK